LNAVPNYEFNALEQARNYRAALVKEFAPFLSGHTLEIGAGIGQLTQELLQFPKIESLASVEPSPEFCRVFREKFPGTRLIEGTAANVDAKARWDTLVSVNVLEHIRDDELELALYRKLLQKSRGHLCLFVPARPELYSPMDQDFGHFRRYTREDLSQKLESQGFDVLRCHYFNLAGYFAWLLTFRILEKRNFLPSAVRFFDRIVFPLTYWCEKSIASPPIGQSLLAIAKSS
jgi:SAM-dependent methyltransferase